MTPRHNFAEIASVTNPDWMKDFEAIRRLNRPAPKADTRVTRLLSRNDSHATPDILVSALPFWPGRRWLQSQTTPSLPSPAAGSNSAIQIEAAPPIPPVPQASKKSPVDIFRELLAMKPDEREHALASRPPESKKRLLEKLHEYEALSPEECETRLRAHRIALVSYAVDAHTAHKPRRPTCRNSRDPTASWLSNVFRLWDALPPGMQKEFLEYGATMTYFVGKDSEAVSTGNPLATLPPAMIIRKMNEVSSLPADRRKQIYDGFQRFFQLTEADKQKTLNTLSPIERQKMAKTMLVFLRLPKGQRDKCLESFGELASMTERERQEFFKNAERWSVMSPAERQVWRNLVDRLPPMPPSSSRPSPPLPPGAKSHPLPRAAAGANAALSVADTNSPRRRELKATRNPQLIAPCSHRQCVINLSQIA